MLLTTGPTQICEWIVRIDPMGKGVVTLTLESYPSAYHRLMLVVQNGPCWFSPTCLPVHSAMTEGFKPLRPLESPRRASDRRRARSDEALLQNGSVVQLNLELNSAGARHQEVGV